MAKEIVELRSRLAELDDQNGESVEGKRLHTRLRHLQDLMSSGAGQEGKGRDAAPDSVQYVPPA